MVPCLPSPLSLQRFDHATRTPQTVSPHLASFLCLCIARTLLFLDTKPPNYSTINRQLLNHQPQQTRSRNGEQTSSQLLHLPTELRLEVYNHLLTSTLADGAASDIAGLYMSCKTTQSEMQTQVANVQPILNVKHAWDIDSQAEGTLHFEAPPNYTYLAPPTELRVLVPLNSKSNNWRHLASLLTPIFHLPLETLRLAVSGAASKDDLECVEHTKFLHFALKWQNGGHSEDRPKFEQINRIVLQHEAPKTTLLGMNIWRNYMIASLGLMMLDAGDALADVKVI
jgi:hypothetical protein